MLRQHLRADPRRGHRLDARHFAWARIGDRRQVEVALDQGRALLERLPYPENLDNHFAVDPAKWHFYGDLAHRD